MSAIGGRRHKHAERGIAMRLKKRKPTKSTARPANPREQALEETAQRQQRPSRSPSPTDGPARATSCAQSPKQSFKQRLISLPSRIGSLVRAIEESDETRIEEAVLTLSRRRRVFSPLAFAIGAFALLFDGLRLLLSNWRLMLVQIPSAVWIWVAMADLKAHVLHGHSFEVLRGPVLIPIILAIVAITVASFFLNAVFAFAITRPRAPEIRPAVARAQSHLTPILVSGAIVGLLLALSTTVVTRWGRPWFTLSLGIVIGVMMICYVAVPARLLGVKPTYSRRDKLWTTVIGGVLGATVSAPPYLLGRLGLLMVGSDVLLIPGIVLLALGVTLQAGATGAVRAIKMSVSLTGPHHPRSAPPPQGVTNADA
jgi:hypothetical protein